MKTKHIIVISMTVFALLAGAFFGITSYVSAQSATDEASSPSEHRRGGGENLESVAEILGVSVDDLREALQNARPAECAEGERPEGVDCRPDFEAVAKDLGVTTEALQSAFETARESARAERLASAAEQLGVSAEALEEALQNARPAECTDLEPGERPADGINCRPDFESVASDLGVTTEELQAALDKGERGKKLDEVAETLGVSSDALKEALQGSRPAECANGEHPEGVNCRPDLEAAAETLGVDAEQLQTALKEARGDRGPRGEGRPGHEAPNGGEPRP